MSRTGTLVLALTSVTVWLCSALAQPPAGRKIAVLVGVKAYNHSDLPDLDYTERDVEDLSKLLDPAGYKVALLTGSATDARLKPTLANIKRELEAALKDVTKRDAVLVALSGHGLQPEGTKESYFCPSDANPTRPATLLPLTGKEGLVEQLADSGVGVKLLLVDACRNDPDGGRGKGVAGDRVESLPRGMAALFSCSPGQRSFETSKAGGGHGVFFHFVLEGLRGKAGKGEAGEVTWSQLADYVQEHVETQVPEWLGKGVKQVPNEVRNLAGRSPVLLTLKASATAKEDLPKSIELDLGGVKLELVLIKEGTFMMGSSKEEQEQYSKLTNALLTDEDEHRVEITRPFYLGKFLVTQEQFTRVTGRDNPSWFSATGGGKEKVKGLDTSRFPVEQVSWDDAVEFCSQLQRQHGNQVPEALRTAGHRFRLPTEAQWEYACRASLRTTFHFGNVLNGKQANCDGNYPWGTEEKGPSLERTERVGRYPANDWALCDMHGNALEWCQDYYAASYYQSSPKKDPVNLQRVGEAVHVLRGGSWGSSPRDCRAAFRHGHAEGSRNRIVGFRVALRLD
jgi:formylglycine-generating enzyme required for sulfatase activity